MSVHDPDLVEGAETVARLQDIDAAERRFVEDMRLWLSGPAGQAAVWNAHAVARGADGGRRLLQSFEAFLAAVADGAKRPLWRHRPGCVCLGQDEAVLAAIVRVAGKGDLETAVSLAEAIVRPADRAAVTCAAGALAARLNDARPAAAPDGPAPGAKTAEASARRDAAPFRGARPRGATLH